jgi:hypothetical protein
VTVDATAPDGPASENERVLDCTGLLKVTVMLGELPDTPVEFAAGVFPVIAGGVVSAAAVLNDQESNDMVLP